MDPTGATSNLADVLLARRDDIVARFVAEVERSALSPRGLPRSLLVDHIPTFLDEVRDELEERRSVRTSQEVSDRSETAKRHGGQRWSLGYDLQALAREYGVLRHCVLEATAEAGVPVSLDEFDVLSKCLSVGVSEAIDEYTRYRDHELDEQRQNLAFLSEAGALLSSSLDVRSTFGQLANLIVPRLADACVLYLDGSGVDAVPIAHADHAKQDLLCEIYRRFPPAPGSPFGPLPAPSRVDEVDDAFLKGAAQSPSHLSLLRQLGLRSWLVVPLETQGVVSGGLMLGQDATSGRRFTDHDLVLVTDLARRASVAIENARLYQLSQRERARMEEATRAKDEFVAMISHELRTPLHAILGWLRLIHGGTLDPEKTRHALAVILRNAEAQSQLVEDLLDVSRVITGKLRISLSSINMNDVIRAAADAVAPAASAKGIVIDIDTGEPRAVLRGDPDRLEQVVWNLLSNAVKFTPKGGRVRVKLRRAASDLELTVEDDGAGIDAAFLPHVFETFRQSDSGSARAHGGLGVGLSIAKHIVELHGGSIEARSPGGGKGSSFIVRLPVAALRLPSPTPPPPFERPSAASIEMPTAAMGGIRVLVVDDEDDARDLVSFVLESRGLSVSTASSATEAISALAHSSPDVIFSDIGMPGDDGYAFIRTLRSSTDARTRAIPAVALTAFARNEDRERALREGFNGYLTKPVDPGALVRAVLDALEASSPDSASESPKVVE